MKTTATKTRKPRAPKNTEVKEVAPKVTVTPSIIKLSLTQTNGKGDVNTRMSFKAETKGDSIDNKAVVSFLGDRLFNVFALQTKIANDGGKSRLFKMTKGGKWYVDIDVITESETATLVSGLEFAFADLGTEKPKEVLQTVFEAWVLINTSGTI